MKDPDIFGIFLITLFMGIASFVISFLDDSANFGAGIGSLFLMVSFFAYHQWKDAQPKKDEEQK